ncbi:1,4-dihydroxy-6-naphtoate synthase [Dactylosporangium sucinum]|uniref:1,4-dihydroxy-6-naphtoate synthase n=1 Tax=Dactylosporangium sucinum TaxID=1424081 RepID=A0A917T9S1_9ACTN|nr:1,4-dihydroxy-6-naphtoate synthase [Dactylosporangium sucinum]
MPGAPRFDVTYADVDVTNTAALRGEFDLVKVSYAALPWLLDQYTLLPCGGALGRGCGPLVLVKDQSIKSLAGRRVAVPGDRTTAYLLMRLWSAGEPPASVEVVPFAEIMPAVAAGTFDAGLVIHEARFTYQRYGLHALADLGEWWENDTGLPIPLGAIIAHRDRVDPEQATAWIKESVRQAWADPAASRQYVLEHAQEMEQDVVDQHIKLYVNEFTGSLGPDGHAAVDALLTRASDEGLVPATPLVKA